MNLARVESLTARDQRIYSLTFNAITRALVPRRFVTLSERSEAAYMVLAAIHAELPPAPPERRAMLRAGRTAVYLTPNAFALGFRVDRDAVRFLLPFWEVAWAR